MSLGRASESPSLSLVASGVFCLKGGHRAGHLLEQMLPLVLGRCGETCKPNLCFQKSSEPFIHCWWWHWVGRKVPSLLNICC